MTKVKRHKKDNNPLFALLDVLITIFSYFLAYFLVNLINTDYFAFTREYIIMLFLIVPTWIILLYTSNLTQFSRSRSHFSIFVSFLNFSFIGFALLYLYKHIFNLDNFSHFVIISFSIINFLCLYSFRMLTYRVFKYFRANGHNICNIIIYANEESDKIIGSIIDHKEWGYRILMIITNSASIRRKYGSTIRIYPDKINIKNILDIDIIDEVIYCHNNVDDKKIRAMIDICDEIGVVLRIQSSGPDIVNNANV
ncbi:MAG: hypothetical protein EHM20_08040, partial [Alphaproteobacteria bacterium]